MKKIPLWVIATLFALSALHVMAISQATETVLYSFPSYATDGYFPFGSLLFDTLGNIYGVTAGGGTQCGDVGGCGTIYKLSPSKSGTWRETILYNFCTTGDYKTCPDGDTPSAGLIMDARGNLYGTTTAGGTTGYGTVFRLSPPAVSGEGWTETVLWTFTQNPNGGGALYSSLSMDPSGNLYGTTAGGGSRGMGAVFELSPQSDGTYSFSILHSFSGSDGYVPEYGVTLDSHGNLYGTTSQGGRGRSICSYGCGVVFELSPSGGTWLETVLLEFDGVVGYYPSSPISIDKFGNLYGTFQEGGGGSCGPVTCGGAFKLSPGSNRKYVFEFNSAPNSGNPESGLAVGPGNTLFGTEGALSTNGGQVYMLQNSQETILYNFCSLPNCADGSVPTYGGSIVLRGNALYGGTLQGGAYGGGVIYRIQQ